MNISCEDEMKKIYQKPAITKAEVTLQAVTAMIQNTGPKTIT